MRIARGFAVVLVALTLGSYPGSAQDEALESAASGWALGLSGQGGIGVLGDSFATFGVGSVAAFYNNSPTYEFTYLVSVIRLSAYESIIRLAGLTARVILDAEMRVKPILGVRLYRLPYHSGFYIRTRWTLGLEGGAMAEIVPGLWARLSAVVLLDQPLLTGYGYPLSGATGIEIAVSYYIRSSGNANHNLTRR